MNSTSGVPAPPRGPRGSCSEGALRAPLRRARHHETRPTALRGSTPPAPLVAGRPAGVSHEIARCESLPSTAKLPRDQQLAWKIAGVAADRVAVESDVTDMIINRMIDNAAVAIAAINRRPVVSARDMALGHPRKGGATVFGVASGKRFSPEWAAWANGTAVRELDYARHLPRRRLFASRRQHPAHPGGGADAEKSGKDLVRGIATGYEIHIDLVRAICLHEYKIDHIAHLCRRRRPASARCSELTHGSDLPGGAAGAACQLHHPPVAQGRDQQLEGLCPRACRQAGGGGGGPRHARRGRAEPDL